MSENAEIMVRFNNKLRKAHGIFIDAINNGLNGIILTDDVLVAVIDLIEEHFDLIEEDL